MTAHPCTARTAPDAACRRKRPRPGRKAAVPCYAVANWSRTYENSESRKLKSLNWLALPVHADGLAYGTILQHPDGERILGAWHLLLQLAARSPIRGVLANGTPYTARHLATITSATEETMGKALALLSSADVALLVPLKWPIPPSHIRRNDKGGAWYLPGDPDASGPHPDASGESPDTRQTDQTTRTRPDRENKTNTTRPEGLTGADASDGTGLETSATPPAGSVNDGSLDSLSGSGPGSGSAEHTASLFARLNYTAAMAVKHACTGDRNGDVRANDIFEAMNEKPLAEAYSIAAEINEQRRASRGSRDAGYWVGAFRRQLGIGTRPKPASRTSRYHSVV